MAVDGRFMETAFRLHFRWPNEAFGSRCAPTKAGNGIANAGNGTNFCVRSDMKMLRAFRTGIRSEEHGKTDSRSLYM